MKVKSGYRIVDSIGATVGSSAQILMHLAADEPTCIEVI